MTIGYKHGQHRRRTNHIIRRKDVTWSLRCLACRCKIEIHQRVHQKGQERPQIYVNPVEHLGWYRMRERSLESDLFVIRVLKLIPTVRVRDNIYSPYFDASNLTPFALPQLCSTSLGMRKQANQACYAARHGNDFSKITFEKRGHHCEINSRFRRHRRGYRSAHALIRRTVTSSFCSSILPSSAHRSSP